MSEYKLSGNVNITRVDAYDVENIPSLYHKGYYILNNKNKNKEFLINETIKFYLDKYSPPQSPSQVLKLIESELQYNSTDLEEKCSKFFDYLCDRKILIPKDHNETIISAVPLFNPGDHIGEFAITNILSESQYLDIYQASDKTGNKNYVIKLLNRIKAFDNKIYQDELTDLKNEYTLMKNADNVSFVCKAHSIHCEDNYAYIVLDYFESTSLSDLLDESTTLQEGDYLQIIESILEAFSLIHANKLIHGDIHTSNILVNEDKCIKIIDFGLSLMTESDKNEVPVFGGVNFYMPPERINISSYKKFSKEPDLYSDVYQIGLVLYSILYNSLPFNGFIWEELAKNIKEQHIIYPETSFNGYKVQKQLLGIIDKCLCKNPLDRYKDASEILKDYRKYRPK